MAPKRITPAPGRGAANNAIAKIISATRRTTVGITESAEQIEMELVKFRADDAEIELNFDFGSDTVWATYGQMAVLFGCTERNVIHHVQTAFDSGEIDRAATTKNLFVVRSEGTRTVRRGVEHFSLDVILSVGYKIASNRAIEFRKFATRTLKAYITDGYALNERRLSGDPQALRKLAAEVRRRARVVGVVANRAGDARQSLAFHGAGF